MLSGELAGQVVVDSAADGDVQLVLDGASITSSTGAALAVTQADEAVVVLADGSSNELTSADTFADTTSEDAPNAALVSMTDLTIGGNGSLTVTAPSLDGIASKDGLVISGGTITVDAADDGIRGKDHIAVTGGTLDVTAGGDALKADNDTDADQGWISVTDGTITLAAGGDGLVATTDVLVSGGTITGATGGGAGTHRNDDLLVGNVRYVARGVNARHAGSPVAVGNDFPAPVQLQQSGERRTVGHEPNLNEDAVGGELGVGARTIVEGELISRCCRGVEA